MGHLGGSGTLLEPHVVGDTAGAKSSAESKDRGMDLLEVLATRMEFNQERLGFNQQQLGNLRHQKWDSIHNNWGLSNKHGEMEMGQN